MQYSCAPRFSAFDLRFTHWFNLRSIKVSAPRLQERRVDLQPAWPKRPRRWTCSTKEQANKGHSLQTAKTRELTANKTVQDKKYVYIYINRVYIYIYGIYIVYLVLYILVQYLVQVETSSNRIWTETQTNPLAPPEPSEQQCKRISKDWKTPWTSKILRLHYECWFVAELLNKRPVKCTGVPSQLEAQSAFTSVLWSILQGITSISANCFLRGSCGVSETEQACQACVSMAITLSKKISCLDQATIGAKLLAKYSALQNVAHLYKSFHVL